MKQRDYDPDFSHLVSSRRRTARLAVLGYAFLVISIGASMGLVVAFVIHFLRSI